MLSVGAILGGAFAFVFGTEAALIADAATFAVAGLLIMRVQYDPARGRKLAKAAGLDYDSDDESDVSFREGLRYIRKTPQMAAALFVKFGLSLGNVDTLLTIFATQIFVLGAQGELSLGILYSALGVGAVLGPVLTNLVNDGSVRRMRRLIGLGFVLLVISWPVLAFSGVILVAAIAIFVRAMGASINWTYSNVIIQKSAPDSKLGRMFSIDMAGSQLATVISTLSHGALIDWLGVAQIDWIILGTMAVSLLPLLLWAWVVPKLEASERAAVSAAGD
jgi:predicted MFS family arabinose efflux permease